MYAPDERVHQAVNREVVRVVDASNATLKVEDTGIDFFQMSSCNLVGEIRISDKIVDN